MSAHDIASSTLEQHIAGNPYPGRGLIIGKAGTGDVWLQVYWIMGRSPNSRNRKFVLDGATLRTEPFDPSKVEDPSLIIYEAMLERPNQFLLSNGDQTRTLHKGLEAGKSIKEALASREREPDAPNHTPRITGMLDFAGSQPEVSLSILKANKIEPAHTDRHYYFPQAAPTDGIGYGLTTYMGDGNPLPTFTGDPLLLPLAENAEETLELYWKKLDADNRISLAVKEIVSDGSRSRVVLRNKYE